MLDVGTAVMHVIGRSFTRQSSWSTTVQTVGLIDIWDCEITIGLTVGEGLEKLSQGRKFFFLMPAPAQLSAYANHEFKIIPTPTQLSAYANHELKN